MFRQLCGDDGLRNVILVTTMHDLVNDDTRNEREGELHSNYWSSMHARGAQYAQFHNTKESGDAIIRLLEGRPQVVLDVQREMVDEDKDLRDTAAAYALQAEQIQLSAELAERRRREEERRVRDIEAARTYHARQAAEIAERQRRDLAESQERRRRELAALREKQRKEREEVQARQRREAQRQHEESLRKLREERARQERLLEEAESSDGC